MTSALLCVHIGDEGGQQIVGKLPSMGVGLNVYGGTSCLLGITE